jgi:gliding motility-associated-like protein
VKKDLNHIDEIFKNSLENFEANVDPSVWANVSQSIGNTAGAASASGTAASGISKSILLYAAASIIATATVVGSVYLLNSNKAEQKVINETTIATQISEENIENQSVIEGKIENVVVEQTNTRPNVEESVEPLTEPNHVVVENEIEKKTTIEGAVKVTNQTESEVVENKNSTEKKTTTEKPETKENQTQTTVQKTEVKEFNISIRSNVKKGKAPLDVEFGVSGEGVSYLWDFGDNTTTSSEETPYHTYKKPGTYKVTLTAIDEDANAKVSYQIIEVEKNKTSKLEEIQNVFSPNGDGINDIIKIEGENISKFHAAVMDSKGNLVYEWNSIDGFWDGRDNNNNKLSSGTYYLIVTAKGEDGVLHNPKKSIQLY